MSATIEIRPQPGRQEQFLSSSADIVIYGGSAGGGKTFSLLMEPTRHIDNDAFDAVIFRRTYPQITQAGGMWDESARLYPGQGAKANQNDLMWTFPAGAHVRFAHMQHEKTKLHYDGAQIPLIGFDQLEHFTQSQFFYMLSRNRSTCGVRPYVRATCNPDPDSWLADFLSWWIADDGYADVGRAGVVRWFVRVGDRLIWSGSKEELARKHEAIPSKSVTFIPATVYDNKILLRKDPGYLANLMALPPVERERLLGDKKRGGNWKVRATAGDIFNRDWFRIVDRVPSGGVAVRFWDFASTEKELASDDPSYTASVLMHYVNGSFYVANCLAFQAGPAEVDRRFKETTKFDKLALTGRAKYCVRWELEPGSASRREAARLVKELREDSGPLDARGVPAHQDKFVRAKGLATEAYGGSEAQAGNVYIVRGRWNEEWLVHMHNQPQKHKDIMDASSGAYNELAGEDRIMRVYAY